MAETGGALQGVVKEFAVDAEGSKVRIALISPLISRVLSGAYAVKSKRIILFQNGAEKELNLISILWLMK